MRQAGERVKDDLPTGFPKTQGGVGVLPIRPADIRLVIAPDRLDRTASHRMVGADNICDAVYPLCPVQSEIQIIQPARPWPRSVRGRPPLRLDGSAGDCDN